MNIKGQCAVIITIVVALILQIIPLGGIGDLIRPDWVLLTMIYWILALPFRYNIFTAWFLGFALDSILGSYIGVRSLSFVIIAYIIVRNYKKVQLYSRAQQILLVIVISILYQLLTMLLLQGLEQGTFDLYAFVHVAINAIIWPWVFWVLRKIRRRYSLS